MLGLRRLKLLLRTQALGPDPSGLCTPSLCSSGLCPLGPPPCFGFPRRPNPSLPPQGLEGGHTLRQQRLVTEGGGLW